MPSETLQLLALALSWLAYGALHSLLATQRAKAFLSAALPSLGRHYRLAYNLLSVVLLLPLLAWTLLWPGPLLWQRPPPWNWLLDALALVALVGFHFANQGYDLATFLGLHRPPRPRLGITWIHRHVRHPWYFYGLLLLWSRDMDAAWLVMSLSISLYLWVGVRLEDAKLVEEFGEAYAEYRRRVPGLIPRPWRRLNAAEAAALAREANRGT